MTEQEWLASGKPDVMLQFLPRRGLDRKLRLFACACARRVSDLISDERPRTALAVAERYVEGQACLQELKKAWKAAKAFGEQQEKQRPERPSYYPNLAAQHAAYGGDGRPAGAYAAAMSASACAARYAAGVAAAGRSGTDRDKLSKEGRAAESATQACMLRDIIGNPFQDAPKVESSWLISRVLELAQKIYDDQSFEQMNVLGDALEQAGCKDAKLLSHLRDAGPHVRGCWALDLILGKK
jgi:hypothetical protein